MRKQFLLSLAEKLNGIEHSRRVSIDVFLCALSVSFFCVSRTRRQHLVTENVKETSTRMLSGEKFCQSVSVQ